MTQIARQPGLVYERTDEGDVAPPVSKYARARALAAQAPAAPSKYAAARQLAAQSMPSSPGMASIVTQPGGMPSTTASQLTRPGSLENLGSTIGDFAQAGADFVQSAPYGAVKDAYDQAAGFGARLANNPTIGRAMEAIGLRPDLANDTSGYEPDVQPPDSVAGQLGRGFGSVGSTFAASALTGGAPVVLPLVAGAQSLGATYQAARDRALQMGADEAQAHQIAAAEADTMGLVSTVTSLPVGKALSGIAPQALSRAVATANRGGQLGQLVKTAVAEGSQEAAEEAAQMILQRVAEDDPAAFQDWQKRIAISAGAGAIGGGVIAGVQAVGSQQGQRQAPQDYPAQRDALAALSPQNAQQFAQPIPRGEKAGPEASVEAVEQAPPGYTQWPPGLADTRPSVARTDTVGSVGNQGPFGNSAPSIETVVDARTLPEKRTPEGTPSLPEGSDRSRSSNLSSLTLAELKALDLERGGTGKGTKAAVLRRIAALGDQSGAQPSASPVVSATQFDSGEASLASGQPRSQSVADVPASAQVRQPTDSPSQPPATTVREPWQMTRAEYLAADSAAPDGIRDIDSEDFDAADIKQFSNAEMAHRASIRRALSEGRPVPPEVLADYPDLKSQAPTPPQPSREEGRGVQRFDGAKAPAVKVGQVWSDPAGNKFTVYDVRGDKVDVRGMGGKLGGTLHVLQFNDFTLESSDPSTSPAPVEGGGGKELPTATIDDIDEAVAVRAFANTSHVPEKRGESYRRMYAESFENAKAELAPLADTPEKMAMLAEELARFKDGLRQRYLAYFHSHANVASSMVTGPANFPVAANQKRMGWADNKWSEVVDYSKRAVAAIRKKIAPESSGVIRSDQKNATELIAKELEEAKRLQEAMRQTNKIITDKSLTAEQKASKIETLGFSSERVSELLTPKFGREQGFPQYRLTNNRANIKRLEGRLSQVERMTTNPARNAGFDGGRVEENKEDMRVRIVYDARPDAATVAKLKRSGFRWSPTNKAWQRLGNEAGWRAALEVTGAKEAQTAPAVAETPAPTPEPAPSQPTPAPKDMAALRAKYPGVDFKPVRGVYIPSTLKGKALAEWRNTASGKPFKDQIAPLDAILGKVAAGSPEPADTANEWASQSPAGRQWARFKEKYPDSLLAMRIGDFYEFFGTDAEKVSKSIGLTLTKRAGVPMAGISYHQLESTLKKLIAAGHRVAVAETVNGNKAGIDGTIARSAERVVTPEKMVEETPDAEPATAPEAPTAKPSKEAVDSSVEPAKERSKAADFVSDTPAVSVNDQTEELVSLDTKNPQIAHAVVAWFRKGEGGATLPEYSREEWAKIDEAFRTLQTEVPHNGPPNLRLFAMPGSEGDMKVVGEKMAKIKGDLPVPEATAAAQRLVRPQPLGYKAGNPTSSPPRVAKTNEDRIRSIMVATSKDGTRFAYNGVFQSKNELVATDGRRMFMLRGKYAEPGLYLADKNPQLQKGIIKKPDDSGATFPPYDAIIPRDHDLQDPFEVDAARAARDARRAAIMTDEDSMGVLVVKNKDKTLGFAALSKTGGLAEINVYDGYTELGAINPAYLAEAFDFILANGSELARVQWGKGKSKPVIVRGVEGGSVTVTMPVNRDGDTESVEAMRDFASDSNSVPGVKDVPAMVEYLNKLAKRGKSVSQFVGNIAEDNSLASTYIANYYLDKSVRDLIRAERRVRNATKGAGGDTGTPGTASRSNMDSLAERMNRIADEARTRRKNRRLPSSMPGFRSGGSPLIPDAIDFGIEIAARAVAKGITGGQALTKHISAALKTLPEELKPYGGRVRYVARRVVLGATKNGVFQPSLMADSIQTERLRHAENDETVKARQKLHKIVGGTEKAKAEPKLRQEIDENLGVHKAPTYTVGGPVDLESLLPEHRYAIATLYTSVKRGKAISGTNEAADFINAQTEKGLANLFTPEMLAELRGLEGRGAKGGMTPDQMDLISRAIQHVAHLSKTERTATVLGQIRQLDEDGAAVVGELEGRVAIPKQGLIDKAMGRAEKEPNPGIVRRFLVRAQDSLGDMLHVAFGDGVMKKYGYEAIAKAEGAKRLEYIKADKKLRDVLDRHKVKAEDVGKATKNPTTFNLPNAGEVKIPAMEALDVVLMAGDQQNTALIVKNGVLSKRFRGQNEKKIELTEADIEALGQQLPKWLMDFGRTGIEIINGYTDQVNATSVAIDGVEIAEKRTGSDYYYPRSPDDVLRTAGVRQDEMVELAWAERLGFTKKRTGSSVPYQIKPAIERIREHIDGVTTYIHMAEPTLNVRKLIARPEVLENVQKRLGTAWRKKLLRHLNESQGMIAPPESEIQGAARWLLRNTARTALWGRLSSAMAQTAGVPMLMNRMTGKERAHMLKHLAKLDWVKNPTVMREMTEASGYFADRYPETGEQTRLGSGIDFESTIPTTPMGRWYNEALRAGFKPMEYGDKVLSALAYMAAKDAGHPDPVFRAEMLIRQSQNATSPMDRSGMMLEGERNALVGALALFSSAPNRVRGQIRADLSDVRANPKSGKAWARLAGTVIAAGIAAAIGESIRELWRRQKVGFSPEDKPRSAVDHLVNSLATLGDSIVPKGGQLLRATINGLRGKVSQTFDSPGMDLADSLGTMLGHLDADEEKAKRLGPNIDRALRALSSFTGVVGEPVYDLGVGIYRTFNPPATIAAYSEAIRAGNYEEARRIAAELRKANPKIDLKARRKNYEERVGIRKPQK